MVIVYLHANILTVLALIGCAEFHLDAFEALRTSWLSFYCCIAARRKIQQTKITPVRWHPMVVSLNAVCFAVLLHVDCKNGGDFGSNLIL